jgi:hypothetical protein
LGDVCLLVRVRPVTEIFSSVMFPAQSRQVGEKPRVRFCRAAWVEDADAWNFQAQQ